MIIFGFRSFVKALGMLTLVCNHCHNPAAHRLVQRSRWFTLFFIPVIPLGFSRYTVCAYCATASKISKDDAERLLAGTSGPQAPQPAPQLAPQAAPQFQTPPPAAPPGPQAIDGPPSLP